MEVTSVSDSITLWYPPLTQGPARLFQCFEGIISSFELENTEVVHSIDPLLDIQFYLDRIEKGSLIVYLLKKIFTPDESTELVQPEIEGDINEYIVQSQDIFAKTLATSKDAKIGNRKLDNLIEEMKEVAEITGVSKSRNFREPNKFRIAESIKEASDSTKALLPDEKIILPESIGKIEFSVVRSEIDLKQIRIELTKRTFVNEDRRLMKVKIADFLGKSKWKFRVGEKIIDAKILDEEWLDKFHNKTDIVTPGDSLEADVRQTDFIDSIGRIIDSETLILKVYKIHEGEIQSDLTG
jgi:hypothetical protein